MRRFKTRRRVALTGTPFSNNLGEYYHMTDWARPNILGTRKEFANQFENPINEGRSSDATRADARRGLQVAAAEDGVRFERRAVADAAVALRALLAAAKKSRADVLAFNEQRRSDLEAAKAAGEALDDVAKKRSSAHLFKVFQVGRKLWCDPRTLDVKEDEDDDDLGLAAALKAAADDRDDASPKVALFLEILDRAVADGDKVLGFSGSLAALDHVADAVSRARGWRRDRDFFALRGSTAQKVRQEHCDAFNKRPQAKLFLLSTGAGALGLNLVAANHVVLMDVSWNPAVDAQAYAVFRRRG
ncbi:hypothetical protein JL720_4791 [Aureococcus anophagefferens]|nr:hypothetical protein JL720_4791 [Aureococcus anophagefferens]